jgi:2-polyprenyl-6-methoxyphenol hydroxylase-like FAD-dependent oxidoreductase
MSQPTISIVGAGIGGLTLGRCLLQRGIRAVLYEKAANKPRHSYAITLQPAAYRPLLKVLNIDENTFKNRVAVDGGVGGTGNINTEGYGYRNLEPSSFRVNRGKLEDLLREGLDVRWEHALQSVDTNGSLSLEFANGQTVDSDIVIGAEGPHSVLRKQLLPSENPGILPYVAFNGKRKVPRATFDSIYAPAFNKTTVTEIRHKGAVLNISINEATADQVSLSWIYSRPARGSSDALHKPNRPNAAAKDIPVEFFQEVEALKELPQPFADVFDAGKLRTERILHWLMRSILISKTELQQLGDKRIWLIGDTAHAEQIIGGGGANSAILDGLSLAEWIAKKGTSELGSWCDERHSHWQESQDKSHLCIAGIHGQQEIGKEPQQHL